MRLCWLSSATRQTILALCAINALASAPARAADPLTMFLLGFAQNLLTSAIEAHQQQQSAAVALPAPLPAMKAPTQMDAADLRALIDESFTYLSRPQRDALMAGLDKALADPANSAQREAIVTQFVDVARQVQFTQRQLEGLSRTQKQTLANQFATNFHALPPEQQQSLQQYLRQGALPLPSDLNEMMLAALSSPRQ